MKRSLSKEKIISDFDLVGKVDVLTFDSKGKRLSTYGGLNVLNAFAEIVSKTKDDNVARIMICKDSQHGFKENDVYEHYKQYEIKTFPSFSIGCKPFNKNK